MRQRLPKIVPLGLLGLLLLGCEGGESIVEAFELSGIVSEVSGGTDMGPVIAGATVTFTSDTNSRETTTTGADGRYRMRVSTDDPFGQVRAEAAGYVPNEETVYFDTRSRRVDIQLQRVPTEP